MKIHKQLLTLFLVKINCMDFNTAKSDTPIMPVVFIGHGSPMNALENNKWTK